MVAGLLAVLGAIVLPNLAGQIKSQELVSSANQLRSLIGLISANASFDGKRYRIRFPGEDELDGLGGRVQPIIEREDDPMYEPEIFVPVTASWAIGETLVGESRCAQMRIGRPLIEDLQDRREQIARNIERALADRKKRERFDADFPPLYIEPDGTSEWAVFQLTTAKPNIALEELVTSPELYPQIEVILEGPTGMCWLQRPFYDEELDLFEDKNWPAVLRQDFLRKQPLTEDDVLELRDVQFRGSPRG